MLDLDVDVKNVSNLYIKNNYSGTRTPKNYLYKLKVNISYEEKNTHQARFRCETHYK